MLIVEHDSSADKNHSFPMQCCMNLNVWDNFLNSSKYLNRALFKIIYFLFNVLWQSIYQTCFEISDNTKTEFY